VPAIASGAATATATESNTAFEAVGAFPLAASVWGQPLRPDLVHRVVVWQQKNARTTLYKAKDRAEVRGGGRKPWRQKGTGRARHGSIRSPLWRGGGVAHGPVFRDWSIDLPKRLRRLGLCVALSAKARDGRVACLDALPLADLPVAVTGGAAIPSAADAMPKTAAVKEWLRRMHPLLQGSSADDTDAAAPFSLAKRAQNAQPSVLLVDVEVSAGLQRACANLRRVKCLPALGVNVRDVVWAERMYVTAAAAEALSRRLLGDASVGEGE